MAKKKICIVGLSRFTSPSGICRYAFNLARIISKIPNTEIFFVIGKWQADYYLHSFKINELNIHLEVIDIPNDSVRRNLWFLLNMPRYASKHGIDWLFLSFPIPIFKSFFKKVKVVTSIHDMYAFEFPGNFRFPFFNRLFTKITITNADVVSALSNITAEKIEKYFPDQAKKIITNYTPFPYKKIDNNQTVDVGVNNFILSVAQHRKNKNLDILAKAFIDYKKLTSSDLKLVLIGSPGPETPILNQMFVEAGLLNDVVFKHGISDEELINHYLACNCFLLLSSTEGLGLPLIESLYYSRRIICSDIPVFHEVDSENCNFVKLDEDPVAQIVNLLSGNMKSNSKFGVKDERFELAAISKRYENLINSPELVTK